MTRRIWPGLCAGVLFLSSGIGLGANEGLADRIKQATDRGVAYLKSVQKKNGLWEYNAVPTRYGETPLQRNYGATALAGLALLECGVPAKEALIQKAAAAVREFSPRMTYTYTIALSIMFLDRLGDPDDLVFIQSLGLRLLAGQNSNFGWGYDCPSLDEAEIKRLTELAQKHSGELDKGTVALRSEWPRKRLETKDMPRRLLAQFPDLKAKGSSGDDNSNTQFGALALWIARRSGVPGDKALARVEIRFRQDQGYLGGWRYNFGDVDRTAEEVAKGEVPLQPEPGMTCAGLLGLAIGNGLALEKARARKGKLPPEKDPAKNPPAARGLRILAAWIGGPEGPSPQLQKKDYYFLWSLERVGVIYGLRTLRKKDWYVWGARALVDNQAADGSWKGDFAQGGCDTSFALLFLCRSNLFPDLTASLKGVHREGAEIGLISRDNKLPTHQGPEEDPEKAAARLAEELIKAPPAEQEKIIPRLQAAKGVAFTDALARVIPQLKGASQIKARAALVERLTRMTPATLRDKFQDDSLEIRRAAALASAKKKSRDHIPDLIKLLGDPAVPVILAAHQSLVEITGKDFGPAPDATRAERQEALAKWQAWWKQK